MKLDLSKLNSRLHRLSIVNKIELIGVVIVAVVSLFQMTSARADALGEQEKFQFNGFVSTMALTSNANDFYGSKSDKFKNYETGLNISYDLNCNVDLHSGLRMNSMSDKPYIDYAFVDVSDGDLSTNYGVRLGKVRYNFGMLDQTRNNPVIRPLVVLPQSVYWQLIDNIAKSGTGVQLHLFKSHENMEFNIEYSIAKMNFHADDQEDVKYSQYGVKLPGTLEAGSPMHVLHTSFKIDNLELTYNYTQLNYEYKKSAGFIPSHELHTPLHNYGVKYTTGKLTLSSEYVDASSNSILHGQNKWNSMYVMAQYEFSDKFTGTISYDRFKQPADPDGIARSKISGNPAWQSFAKDLVIGGSYRFNKNLTARAELHTVRGTAWLPHSYNPDSNKTSEKWNMLATSLTYSF